MIEAGVRLILEGLRDELGLDTTDENFRDTPSRVLRMYREVLSGIRNTQGQVDAILASAFVCNNNNLILVKDIEVFSLCPHHLLPVHYKVQVAYIPKGSVVGISKLARLVDVLAKRLVLQEQFVEDVTSSLMRIKGCLGAACVAEGIHYCMLMRGIRQSTAKTITSSLQGVFLKGDGHESARQELMGLIKQ